MQPSPKIARNLQKYAHLIGGVDDTGNLTPIPNDARLKEHLFYIKNREDDNMSGEFILGHVIRSKIIDGIYDIEYVGLNRYSRKPREGEAVSKEHQKVLDRIAILAERQEKDVVQAKIAHLESLGIFVDENDLRQATSS